MDRRGWWLLALATLGTMACTSGQGPGVTIDFQGDDVYKWFPFNGERIWTYQSTDTSLTYQLRGVLSEDSRVVDERTRIYKVDFRIDCRSADDDCVENELAFSWEMSADSGKGVLFHTYDDTVYDPPVRLSRAQMVEGDSITTESGGTTFTATYNGLVECPAIYWRNDKPDCGEIVLDDGGAGTAIAGTYWAVTQFNVVAFKSALTGEEWQLRDFFFDD